MRVSRPAIRYLVTSSKMALESFELARLSRVANLRKELRDVVKDWVESEVEARIARFLLEEKRAQDGDRSALAPDSAPARARSCFLSSHTDGVNRIEIAGGPVDEGSAAISPWRAPRALLPSATSSVLPCSQMELFAEPLAETRPPQLVRLLPASSATNSFRPKLRKTGVRTTVVTRTAATRHHRRASEEARLAGSLAPDSSDRETFVRLPWASGSPLLRALQLRSRTPAADSALHSARRAFFARAAAQRSKSDCLPPRACAVSAPPEQPRATVALGSSMLDLCGPLRIEIARPRATPPASPSSAVQTPNDAGSAEIVIASAWLIDFSAPSTTPGAAWGACTSPDAFLRLFRLLSKASGDADGGAGGPLEMPRRRSPCVWSACGFRVFAADAPAIVFAPHTGTQMAFAGFPSLLRRSENPRPTNCGLRVAVA